MTGGEDVEKQIRVQSERLIISRVCGGSKTVKVTKFNSRSDY